MNSSITVIITGIYHFLLFVQILSQCTHKLGLASAARKIFTEDGTMVMEIDDLIDWAVENYKSLMVDQLEKILNGKENTTEKGKSRINMLNS